MPRNTECSLPVATVYIYDHPVESGDRNALCIEISHYWLECLERLSVCMQ